MIAVAASSILAVEYEAAAPGTFCGADGGCATVRASEFARYFSDVGLDLPRLGVFGFVGLLTASLFASSRLHHLVIGLASALAGVFALVFIGAQLLVIDAICPFCVVVDGAAIVCAVTGLVLARRAPERSANARNRPLITWATAAVVASAAPFVWHAMPSAPKPPAVVSERLIPGKITAVMFTDFECPFCRKMHGALDAAVEAGAGTVAVVRIMAPLDSHPGAMPAAKAYVCAPEAGREAMAHALYDAAPETLTDEGVLGLATAQGLDVAAFRACFEAPATQEQVTREKASFKATGARGIPLTYVGGTPLLGYDPEGLEQAIRRQNDAPIGLPIGAMYGLLFVVFAVAAASSREEDPFVAPPAPRGTPSA